MSYIESELFSAHAHGMDAAQIPIRIIRRQHNQRNPVQTHRHDFTEIAIILSGNGTQVLHTSNNERITVPVARGDICTVMQGQSHAYTFLPDESISIINILFSRAILQKAATYDEDRINLCDFVEGMANLSRQKPKVLRLSDEALERVCGLVERIEAETAGWEPGAGTMVLLSFAEILTCLYREYRNQSPDRSPTDVGWVSKLLAYLDRHFQEEITLEQLSLLTHFSTRQITRRFKATVGVSVSQYILLQRIALARNLLTSTDMKITNIATEVGFSNPSYFCEQFRRVVHCTPTEFRNRSFMTHDESDQ